MLVDHHQCTFYTTSTILQLWHLFGLSAGNEQQYWQLRYWKGNWSTDRALWCWRCISEGDWQQCYDITISSRTYMTDENDWRIHCDAFTIFLRPMTLYIFSYCVSNE